MTRLARLRMVWRSCLIWWARVVGASKASKHEAGVVMERVGIERPRSCASTSAHQSRLASGVRSPRLALAAVRLAIAALACQHEIHRDQLFAAPRRPETSVSPSRLHRLCLENANNSSLKSPLIMKDDNTDRRFLAKCFYRARKYFFPLPHAIAATVRIRLSLFRRRH